MNAAQLPELIAQRESTRVEFKIGFQKEVSGQLNKVVRTLLASGHIEQTIPDEHASRLPQNRLPKPPES